MLFHRQSSHIRAFLKAKVEPAAWTPAVLVTLVHTEGSCYQKAGSQLLLCGDGSVYGLVSGGCLEQAILEEALRTRARGKAQLQVYTTSDAADVDFGYGMGCGGQLWVFFEVCQHRAELQSKVHGLSGCSQVEGIVVEADDPLQLGRRTDAGAMALGLNSPLASLESRSEIRTLSLPSGGIRLARLRHLPQGHLAIFGAGPGAWPLAAFAENMGWDLCIRDHRESYREDFPQGLGRCESLPREILIPSQTATIRLLPADRKLNAAVVMTHSFRTDLQILAQLLREPWLYIAVLGSPQRCAKLYEELCRLDPGLEPAELRRRCRGPAGFAWGGPTVEGMALSIVAEIQACWQLGISS